MRRISAAVAVARQWLADNWYYRDRAREVMRQYRAMQESCPLALADILNFACAFSSTEMGDAYATGVATGKREVALHLQTMMKLTPEDLRHLQERTDRE